MTHDELDFYFPMIVFGYGLVMSFVLQTPFLMGLAEKRLPGPLVAQFRAHSLLAWMSLGLGALWSLQNIWFRS